MAAEPLGGKDIMINARAKKTAGNICLNLIYALIGAAMLLPIYYLVIDFCQSECLFLYICEKIF